MPTSVDFPTFFSSNVNVFTVVFRIVLILRLNPLKLTTQPDPKGISSSGFVFHKHRCCPSVCEPAWWPFSRVAACWLSLLTHVGVVRDHTCLRLLPPAPPPHSHCHSLTHHPLIFQLSKGLHRRPVLIFKSPGCFYTSPISSPGGQSLKYAH